MNFDNPMYSVGYEAERESVRSLGWTAARDEFNRQNPPGQRWSGTVSDLARAQGAFQALFDTMSQQEAA